MRALWLLVPVALLLPGCLGDQFANTVAHGKDPFVSLGWGYDGKGNTSTGTIKIDTNDITNQGSVLAAWNDPVLGSVQLGWTQFAADPAKPFQNGGIVRELDAHGNTMHGDANLPNVHYISAGWGLATLSVAKNNNTTTLRDPVDGVAAFHAHYMIIRDAIRDPKSHMITKPDGTTPYDPATPGVGKITKGKTQLLVLLQGNQTAVPARDIVKKMFDQAAGPTPSPPMQGGRRFPVAVPADATEIHVTVNVTSPAAPTPFPGQVTLRLVNPKGTAVGMMRTLGGPQQTRTVTFDVTGKDVVGGQWNLTAQETVAGQASYTGSSRIHLPELVPLFRLLTFDNVVLDHPGLIAKK